MFKHIKKFFRNIDTYEINFNELLQMQKNGAFIIDVRSPQEYKEAQISGAINIPYYDINKKIRKIIPNLNSQIVVYCQYGQRSKKAFRMLKNLEYKNVYTLNDGIDNIK